MQQLYVVILSACICRAGSMVTKDVLDYALVVGNLRQIGWISEFGNRLNFDSKGIAICPEMRIICYLKIE